MKLSARNALHGKIQQVHKGVTTTIVKVDIGNGIDVTSSITNESADELDLKPGDAVTAIIKSSDHYRKIIGGPAPARPRPRAKG